MEQNLAQRLRLAFERGKSCRWVSHLDMVRLWERALRRGEIPLAYSEGFSPHPKIAIALPLPTGVTGERELLDVYLYHQMALADFLARLSPQLPPGIGLNEVKEAPLTGRALPALVRSAEYRVLVADDRSQEEMEQSVAGLLAADQLPREWRREKGLRRYDLRPLVHSLQLNGPTAGGWSIGMILKASPEGTGRPEEVLLALQCEERAKDIHRVALFIEELGK